MKKAKGSNVMFFFIMLVVGFLLSYSFQITREKPKLTRSPEQWEKEYQIRQLLIEQEKMNKELQEELYRKQKKVTEIEENLKKEKEIYYRLVEDVEKMRMFVGEVGVKGEGVEVTLEDASYIPEGENVNNYIVHEYHLFKVVNELLISGAAAVAINGQRIFHDSYIQCNGPVVTVDGNQFPAPFVITAIGDAEVLYQALNIAGGVLDQLSYENIVVAIEKKKEIKLGPRLTNESSPKTAIN